MTALARALAAADPATDGSAAGNTAAAVVILAFALAAIALSLGFALLYHFRLFKSIDAAVAGGTVGTVSTQLTDSLRTLGRDDDPKIKGPMSVTKGSEATFTAVGFDPSVAISWTVEGGKPGKASGTGTTFATTFAEPGAVKVTAAQPGKQAEYPLTVTEPKVESRGGVVLPFVIRNWGRLVVTLLGIGVVAALMTLDVITGEGGIGLLGALLGIGAASANSDPDATTKPDPPTTP